MTGQTGLAHMPRGRRLINSVTARVVALGGAAVIGAIALIFFYLLWVVAPVFVGASVETGPAHVLGTADTLLVEANDSDEIGLRVDRSGQAAFFRIEPVDGETSLLSATDLGRELAQVKALTDHTGLYALIATDGAISFIRTRYPIGFQGDTRVISPVLEFEFEQTWQDIGADGAFDVFYRGYEMLVANVAGETLTLHQFRDVEPGFELEPPREATLQLPQQFDRVMFGPRGRWLYLVALDGAVSVLDLARPLAPRELFVGRLVSADTRVTDVAPLLGSYSLLVADNNGRITQWFMVRGEFGQRLEPVRHFDLDVPARRLIPEPRRKGFAAIDNDDQVHLFYSTSERHLASAPLANDDVVAASISPRSDLLLTAGSDGAIQSYHLHNEHPEISWSTLWSEVWYEGYPEPVHSWQSSSADNDFEPKFSLTPLLFGTLKAAFYAMVFAVPVAIMGALYTAYFMAPVMRRIVKPGIEIMAALPTVILGFLAGLWLAPLIEANLSAVLGNPDGDARRHRCCGLGLGPAAGSADRPLRRLVRAADRAGPRRHGVAGRSTIGPLAGDRVLRRRTRRPGSWRCWAWTTTSATPWWWASPWAWR